MLTSLALPVIGPFLAMKKERAEKKQLSLPDLFKTLQDVRSHPDMVPELIRMHPGAVRNSLLYPKHEEPTGMHLMLTAIKYMLAMIQSSPSRFVDIPGPSACLDIAIEDWMRAFCVLQFVGRKITSLFASRPNRVTPKGIYWGSPHALDDDPAAGDGDGRDRDPGAERTAQTIDSIYAIDAAARVNAALNSGETATSGSGGRDDDRAERHRLYESITTIMLTAPGYPQNRDGEAGRPNAAPRLRAADQEGLAGICRARHRIVVEDPTEAAPTLAEVVAMATGGGAQSDLNNMLDQAAVANNNAEIDDEEQLAHQQAQIAEALGETQPDKQDEAATMRLLTGESTMPHADFLKTMHKVGWGHLIDDYYATGKVRINKDGGTLVRDFGLTAGQVVGKFNRLGARQKPGCLATRGFRRPLAACLAASKKSFPSSLGFWRLPTPPTCSCLG